MDESRHFSRHFVGIEACRGSHRKIPVLRIWLKSLNMSPHLDHSMKMIGQSARLTNMTERSRDIGLLEMDAPVSLMRLS